jgi:hypothetical protein
MPDMLTIHVVEIKRNDWLEVTLTEGATIGDLKAELSRSASVPLEGMRIIHNRKFCQDSETLASLNLTHASFVKAYIRGIHFTDNPDPPEQAIVRAPPIHRPVQMPPIRPDWQQRISTPAMEAAIHELHFTVGGHFTREELAALLIMRDNNVNYCKQEITARRFTRELAEEATSLMRVVPPEFGAMELKEMAGDLLRNLDEATNPRPD